MKNIFKKKTNLLKKSVNFFRFKREKPRDKYLKIGLRVLLFVSIFLAGYLTAKLQTLFSLT